MAKIQSPQNWGLGGFPGLGCITMTIALSLSGCATLPSVNLPFINQNTTLPSVQSEIAVQPGSMPGIYEVSGKTAFPDRSALRVAAIRYLYPTNPASQILGSRPTYSILAYDGAIVENGTWKVPLKLWQTAPDGQQVETWQLTQRDLKLQVKPAEKIVFIATLAPGIKADSLQNLEQALLSKKQGLDTAVISRMEKGDRFLQLIQTVAAPLPTGKVTPPVPTPDELNGGWGNRFLMPDEPPNPNNLEFPANRRTNARPRPEEFMR
jgi:hypothetical protein